MDAQHPSSSHLPQPLGARLSADCAEQTARLQKLADAALAISAAVTLKDTLKAVTERAREVIGAQQAITTLVNGADWANAQSVVSFADQYGAWRAVVEQVDGEALYKLVCETNRPVRLTQAELEAQPTWLSALRRPVRGWLAAPLIGRDGQNNGLIQLSDKDEGDFDEEDEVLLMQLAQLASIAVANARLYEIVRKGRARMQALSKQLLAVQENERRSIASELHDEVGQMLTGLKLSLDMLPRLPRDASEQKLSEAQALVNELIQRVREMSLNMRPAVLDDLGLVPALLWHFGRYTSQTQVRVHFKHSGVEGWRFPSEIEIGVYRIVQEALTNVARHAGVQEVSVRLWADANSLVAQIEDRGRGFDPSKLAAGMSSGVSGIRERAYMLGGLPTIESELGRGTIITVELPLHDVLERRSHERFDSAGR